VAERVGVPALDLLLVPHVAARAERVAGAGQHRDPRPGVALERGQRRAQFVAQSLGVGVLALRSVERDPGDALVVVELTDDDV
jgi:DNA-binding transcriptional LysR family regulator